jgi:hypothetical protein
MPRNTIDSCTILGLMGLLFVNIGMPPHNGTSFPACEHPHSALLETQLYSPIMLVLVAQVRYTVSTIELQIRCMLNKTVMLHCGYLMSWRPKRNL